ncbi:MAG: GNAT family protein [Bacteroidota bacterium]|nr:GNAT family protein [Bacteroidota bacterium]
MLKPVTLSGHVVRLVPLSMGHLDAFCDVGLKPSIWAHNAWPVRSRADMQAYIQKALDAQAAGHMLPFATTLSDTGEVVGSTRFGAIDLVNRRMEIGWTWITPAWQRTAINTEAKLLMLRYAFDEIGCQRVEWKTDALNEHSRNAILRLGAQFEGMLRSHMIREDGSWRDTVYYSVLKEEWPAVEAGLIRKLDR